MTVSNSRKNRDWPRKVKVGNVVVTIYREAHKTYASGFRFKVWWTEAGVPKHENFADEAEALDEARLKAEQLNAGRIEGASMTLSDREELLALRKISGDVPPLAALQEWKKIRELTNGHGISAAEAWAARNTSAYVQVTVETAVDDFLAAKKKAGVDVSASYKKILPTLKAAFVGRLLETVSAKELQTWMHKRYPHPVTFNTARKRFVTLWRWCRKQGYLPRDAQTEAELLDSAEEDDGEIGVITSETFSKLLEFFRARHPNYLPALVIAGFAGLRRSEVHAQVWEDVVLDRKFLRVTKAKKRTPARRIVPLSDAAVEWLMLSSERKGAICPNLAIDRIRDIARDAGFQLPENCFRHSQISHRVAQTGNMAETALESGNSSTIIFQHYRELFTKHEGEEWFVVRPKKLSDVVSLSSA